MVIFSLNFTRKYCSDFIVCRATYTEQESTCTMHFLHWEATTFSAPRGSIPFDFDKMRTVSCTSAQHTMYFMELRGMTKANSQFEWEVCMRHADGYQSEKESKSFQRRTGSLSMNVALLFFFHRCTLKEADLWFHFVMTYVVFISSIVVSNAGFFPSPHDKCVIFPAKWLELFLYHWWGIMRN